MTSRPTRWSPPGPPTSRSPGRSPASSGQLSAWSSMPRRACGGPPPRPPAGTSRRWPGPRSGPPSATWASFSAPPGRMAPSARRTALPRGTGGWPVVRGLRCPSRSRFWSSPPQRSPPCCSGPARPSSRGCARRRPAPGLRGPHPRALSARRVTRFLCFSACPGGLDPAAHAVVAPWRFLLAALADSYATPAQLWTAVARPRRGGPLGRGPGGVTPGGRFGAGRGLVGRPWGGP